MMNKYSIMFHDNDSYTDSINCNNLKEVKKELKALKNEEFIIDSIRINTKGVDFDEKEFYEIYA